jgi:tubulin-folding cofactor B
MLGFYPCEDGYFLEVIADKTVLGVPFGEEDPNFERFKLSDEEYSKKKGTLKEFLSSNKLGQYSDTELKEQKEKQAREKLEKEKLLINEMKVGSRCKVTAAGASTRLGTILYLGSIANKPGSFVGKIMKMTMKLKKKYKIYLFIIKELDMMNQWEKMMAR